MSGFPYRTPDAKTAKNPALHPEKKRGIPRFACLPQAGHAGRAPKAAIKVCRGRKRRQAAALRKVPA